MIPCCKRITTCYCKIVKSMCNDFILLALPSVHQLSTVIFLKVLWHGTTKTCFIKKSQNQYFWTLQISLEPRCQRGSNGIWNIQKILIFKGVLSRHIPKNCFIRQKHSMSHHLKYACWICFYIWQVPLFP